MIKHAAKYDSLTGKQVTACGKGKLSNEYNYRVNCSKCLEAIEQLYQREVKKIEELRK